MQRIFRNKWISALIVTAVLVPVLLACMLLVTLSQRASLNQRVATLNEMIEDAYSRQQVTDELLQYMQTDEYVMKWAQEHEMIPSEYSSWLSEQMSNSGNSPD